MESDKILRYNAAYNKIMHGDKVIIANTSNGCLFKLSRECFEILDQCIEKKMKKQDILAIFEEEEDRKYFEKLLNVLEEYEILVVNEEKTAYLPYLLLTKRCNLSCIHCSENALSVAAPDELTTEEWFSVADKMKGMNLIGICVSGGEPLVRDDMLDITRYFKKTLGVKMSLMSNATLINEDNAESLLGVFDNFSFSLDGIDEATCSMIRGKGTFTKAMKGIEIMKSKGMIDFSLSFTLTKDNSQYKDEFCELAEKIGAKPMLRHYDLAGRALEHQELMTEEDMSTYFSTITFPNGDVIRHFAPNRLPMCTSCGAGSARFCISHNGNMYPCQLLGFSEYCYDNVKNINSLKDYIEGEQYKQTKGYQRFMDIYTPQSEQCKDCHARLHCATCAYASHLLKQMKNKDEICNLKRKELEIIWN